MPCYRFVLEKLITDLDQHCKKTCVVKEFQVMKGASAQGPRNNYIDIRFQLPDATRGFMSKTPYKTIKTEQYIVSGLQLLGNVGGILGIFVGISFLGISEPILSVCEKLRKKYFSHST